MRRLRRGAGQGADDGRAGFIHGRLARPRGGRSSGCSQRPGSAYRRRSRFAGGDLRVDGSHKFMRPRASGATSAQHADRVASARLRSSAPVCRRQARSASPAIPYSGRGYELCQPDLALGLATTRLAICRRARRRAFSRFIQPPAHQGRRIAGMGALTAQDPAPGAWAHALLPRHCRVRRIPHVNAE